VNEDEANKRTFKNTLFSFSFSFSLSHSPHTKVDGVAVDEAHEAGVLCYDVFSAEPDGDGAGGVVVDGVAALLPGRLAVAPGLAGAPVAHPCLHALLAVH
jgi:hypothetical protein